MEEEVACQRGRDNSVFEATWVVVKEAGELERGLKHHWGSEDEVHLYMYMYIGCDRRSEW